MSEERAVEIVRQWMTSPAVVVLDTLTVPEVRQLLRERRIRRVPVVDRSGRLVGIVTEGDISRVSHSHETDVREYNLYHRVSDLPVGDIMTRDVAAVSPDTPIADLARVLYERRIGGVPVVEGERVVGVITESDLLRMIFEAGGAPGRR